MYCIGLFKMCLVNTMKNITIKAYVVDNLDRRRRINE